MRKFVKTLAPLKSSLVPEEQQLLAETARSSTSLSAKPNFSSSLPNDLEIGAAHTSLPSTSSSSYDFSKIPISAPPQTSTQPPSPNVASHEQKQSSAPTTTSSAQDGVATSGYPLDTDTRAYMEPRFQHDFSKIRIHTDTRAAIAARNVNATAYTIGQDIVFDSGQYQPETDTGKHLLAHELAHTIQQSRGGSNTPPPLPTHPLERAAQQAASIIAQGGTASVAGASAPGVARQPRSLSESLNPSTMSDADLQQEIMLIQQWLADNQTSSPEGDQLTAVLSAMETEAANRNNQTPADQGQSQTSGGGASTPASASSTGGASTIAGASSATLASMAMGNYKIPQNVANFLRSVAREGAYEDLVESIESGTYSENSLYTSGQFTPDQLQEFAERYREVENDPAAFRELIQEMKAEVSHLEPLASNPAVAGESELTVVTGKADHLYGQHGGNYSNDPGSSSNPDWESNPAEDEMFGEGSHLRVASEGEDLGMTGEEAATSSSEAATTGSEAAIEGAEVATEGVEGAEILEGASVAVEAAEGFEAADLLVLLLFL